MRMELRGLFTSVFVLGATLGLADLHYTLTPEPDKGDVVVTLTLEKADKLEKFRIPAWCPGFYFLLDYDKKIKDFKAVDDKGQALEFSTPERREWDVKNPAEAPITISYKVIGD